MLLSAGLALGLSVALAAADTCAPGPAVTPGPGSERVRFDGRIAFLEDAGGRLALEDVAGPEACARFEGFADSIFSRGGTRFWLRARLDLGPAPAPGWLLFVPIANFDRACAHWPLRAGSYASACNGPDAGDSASEIRHNYPLFPVPDALDPERSFFVEVDSRVPHDLRVELVRALRFYSDDHPRQFLGGLFNGLLFATVLYNLIFFFAARDRVSLFFALHLAGLGLAMLGFEGRGLYLWPWLGRLGASVPTAMLAAAFFFGCVYARDFLMTPGRAPRLDAMLRLAMIPALAALPFSLVQIHVAEQLLALAVLGFVGSLVTAAAVVAHRGYRPALFLLVGLSAFLAGIVSVSLRTLGVSAIPDDWGVPLTRAGLVGASIAISAGLGRRVMELRRERDRAARAEAAAAEEWRSTFDAVDVLVVLLDGAGRVIRLNRAAAEACRLTFGEALGRPLEALATGEPWRTAVRALSRLGGGGTRVAEVVRDPASARTWGLSIIRFRLPASEDARTALVARDLTEVTRLEESLRRRENMAAMGALVAGVAHEVRNPLFGISSTVDALEARGGPAGAMPRHLETLRSQVERLGKLMNDLLEYGRPRALERWPENLAAVVADASRACDYLLQDAGAGIEIQVQGELPLVPADRKSVVQVFQNLLENALRHSPPGASVEVELGASGPGDAFVRALVRDRGPGFALADLPRVFEPFFTRRQGGTGLGLSIVRRIVEQHGGEVEARNHPGGGAEVIVWFPTAPPPTEEASAGQPLNG